MRLYDHESVEQPNCQVSIGIRKHGIRKHGISLTPRLHSAFLRNRVICMQRKKFSDAD
jgi:hypothetical protein